MPRRRGEIDGRGGGRGIGGRQNGIEFGLGDFEGNGRRTGVGGAGFDDGFPVGKNLVGIGADGEEGGAAHFAAAAEEIEGFGGPGDHGARRVWAALICRFINSKWSFIRARIWRPRGVMP